MLSAYEYRETLVRSTELNTDWHYSVLMCLLDEPLSFESRGQGPMKREEVITRDGEALPAMKTTGAGRPGIPVSPSYLTKPIPKIQSTAPARESVSKSISDGRGSS